MYIVYTNLSIANNLLLINTLISWKLTQNSSHRQLLRANTETQAVLILRTRSQLQRSDDRNATSLIRERERLTAAVVSEVTVTPVTSSQLSSSSSESPMRSSSIRTAPETNQRSGWDVGGRDGIGERQSFNTTIRTIRIVRDARKERGGRNVMLELSISVLKHTFYIWRFFFYRDCSPLSWRRYIFYVNLFQLN